MQPYRVIVLTTFILLTNVAWASGSSLGIQLLKDRNCMSCHAYTANGTGPSYKAISTKYMGQDVQAQLIDKVIKGSTGVWGTVAMPANPQLNPDEAAEMVRWILDKGRG